MELNGFKGLSLKSWLLQAFGLASGHNHDGVNSKAISFPGSYAVTSGRIIVGNGSNVGAVVAMSGDTTIDNAGAVTIGAKKVTAAKTALAEGKILVGAASGAAAEQTVSGDGTLSAAGVLTIGAGKVSKAKMAMYASAERTATGSEESIAHGLGAVPALVLVIPTDTSPSTAGVFTALEGTHTGTNVLVTVTADKKYKVVALA